ncbi:MAG: iron ABC transporter permease [Corynebacterium sp.]|uniref:ABC transporter permease n=1 Tax=Corynebacterium sp. TaxID=1720 RepID=UPI0026DBEAE8|nr:iron ABC transporter permease [Corynebacterium sp.]MDO5099829.1 iron ABC transporter permease [Corynebacterium sp.]
MTTSHRFLLGLAIGAAALVAAPLFFLIAELMAAPSGAVIRAFTRPNTITHSLNTLYLVVTVAAGALVLGVSTAFCLVRLALPLPRLWWVAATLPLAVPSYVAGLSWVSATDLRGFVGSWLVLVLATTPYVTLPTAAAFRRADRGIEDVARTLGSGPVLAFIRMSLPQVIPAAAAGALLVALYCLAEYGVVSIMRFPTLTPAVQTAFSGSFNRTLAIVLSALLVVLAIIVVACERLLRQPVTSTRIAHGHVPPKPLPWWGTWGVCAWLLGIFALSVGLPIGEQLYRLSLSVAQREFEGTRLLYALGTTVALGLIGAALATALALPISVLAARRKAKSVAAIETVTYIGHGLPGVVLGLSMVYLALRFLPFLYQTMALMVVAYAIMFVPKAMGSTRTAIAQVPTTLEDAARSLGRNPRQTWLEVTARLSWPGIASGALIVAVTVMKELPATLMMRPIGTDTLATRLWQLSDINAYGAAAPYALALIAAASIPALMLAGSPDSDR